jgi:glycosyltransferase involved in cell wall biosynthesis
MKVRYPIITNYSGGDVYFRRLADGISSQGWEPELVTYPHLLEFLPCTAIRPFLPKAGKADLVHTKAEYGWIFRDAATPLFVTLAHSVFDPEYDRYKGLVKRTYHNFKLRGNILRSFERAERIVTVSRFSAARIGETFGVKDIRVIYNGVDTDFFCPAEQTEQENKGPVRILFVGNMTARKGFPLLEPILERLGEGYVVEYTTGLRTRGSAPPHRAMQPLGKLEGEDLLRAYQRCDIFLFPSRLEGFGYPVAEAMACAKPVVTTNYSSLPELIEDGKGGYLCPIDDINAFAESVARLADDPDLRRRMGEFNRNRVRERFSHTRCMEQYAALYRECL